MSGRKAGGKRMAGRAKSQAVKTASGARIGEGWQAEKSALTRQAILEAAVRCFVFAIVLKFVLLNFYFVLLLYVILQHFVVQNYFFVFYVPYFIIFHSLAIDLITR